MSFETARMIIQSYRQDNEQRIKRSMDLAYQSAMMQFRSEEQARAAALEVLQNETKIFDTMLKDINKSRQQILMGEIKKAQKIQEIRHRNLIGEARVQDANNMREYTAAQKQQMRDYGYRGKVRNQIFREQEIEATTGASIVGGAKALNQQRQAVKFARPIILADDLMKTKISKGIQDVSAAIKNNKNETAIVKKLEESLAPDIQGFLREKSTTETPIGLEPDDAFRFRKADLAHNIMEEIKNSVGPGKASQLELVKDFLYDENNTRNVVGKKLFGILSDVEQISPEMVDAEFQRQQQLYLQSKGLGTSGQIQSLYIEPPPRVGAPPQKEFIPEPEPELLDMSIGRALREKAQPVFKALRNDFTIDDSESKNITPEQLQAYQQLQQLVIENPLAVTKEEQLLLDESVLRQQRTIQQQEQRVQSIQPQLASIERIRARAAELLEPEKKRVDASKYTPTQQKYYAVARKAYELSEKDDDQIRSLGIPEKVGVSLWQTSFNPGDNAFRENYSYETVMNELNQQFPNDPEGYLRALQAYNSRAMALQKSSSPLVLPDGEKNNYWLESLKALEPKEEK